jgi:hypothetical protein
MAAFGSVSLANLGAVKPITAYRANEMAAYVTAHGGDIGIPAYGGLRTMAQQAQLLKWEQDSVAAGGAPYAVHAPNASAAHTTGDAFDVKVNTPMDGLTVDQTYLAMAQYAPTLGLTAGYFFKSVPSDPYHFENTDRSLNAAPNTAGSTPATPDGTANPDGTPTYNGMAYDPTDAGNPYNLNPTNPDGTATYNGLPYDPNDPNNPYTVMGGLPPQVSSGFSLSVPSLLAIAALAFIGWKAVAPMLEGEA